MKIKIKYLSNGPTLSGGFNHENFWFQEIDKYYQSKGFQVVKTQYRPEQYHSGFWTVLKWFIKLFSKSGKADLILTPGRCALPILIRNLFTKTKIWVVFHSLNTEALKGNSLLAFYYTLLFKLVRIKKSARIIVVSEFWIDFFEIKMQVGKGKTFKLPNLFITEEFEKYRSLPKKKSIHLGLWSSKLDKSIYELAAFLSHRGYYCFFTSPIDLVSFGSYGYEILYCATDEEYRTRIAEAEYTLTFSRIPEGWSRVSHESFLLGTPVIGSDNSGLGDLLREANGFIVSTVSETLELIDIKPNWKLSQKFELRYHVNKAIDILDTVL